MGDSNPKVYNNIIMYNKGLYGPGIVMNYSGGIFKNNIIIYNSGAISYNGGGAFWVLSTSPGTQRIIENNTILNNSSATGTGGILCYSSSMIIRNNILRGNIGPNNNQIQVISGGSVNATYNNVQGGYNGAGNNSEDPMFADSNYILQTGSPCIDKGDSSVIYNDLPDQGNPSNAKYPSRGGLRNDMGAYGGPMAELLTNQLIGINQNGSMVPSAFRLYQNYPNPFNPSTNINFDLPESDNVKISVYDISGRVVKEITSQNLTAGSYSFTFDGANLSSGIYFYTLKTARFTETRKMVLVK